MSPEEYRKKWGLPGDYSMIAPEYQQQKADSAKKTGLGRAGRPNLKDTGKRVRAT